MAQILSVLDCLITSLTLPVSLCLRSFTVPTPLSFHWFPSLSNLYSFAFLQQHTRRLLFDHNPDSIFIKYFKKSAHLTIYQENFLDANKKRCNFKKNKFMYPNSKVSIIMSRNAVNQHCYMYGNLLMIVD